MNACMKIAFVLPLILVSSCGIVPKLQDLPSLDYMYIHDNPRVGDFAEYSMQGRAMVERIEVVDVLPGKTVIRYNKRNEGQNPETWYYRKLDHEGRVLQAWMIEDGQRYATPVSRAGEIGSMEQRTPVRKSTPGRIRVPAGRFAIHDTNSFIHRLDFGLAGTVHSTIFDKLSNDVPFRKVQSEIIGSSDMGVFLKTMDFISRSGDAIMNENYISVYNNFNMGDTPHHVILELKSFGWGEK